MSSEFGAVQVDRICLQINSQAPILPDLTVNKMGGAPQDRMDPGHHLCGGERFGNTIVGALLQSGQSLFEFSCGGQHNHRAGTPFPDLLQNLAAIHSRQRCVKEPGPGEACEFQSLLPVQRLLHPVSGLIGRHQNQTTGASFSTTRIVLFRSISRFINPA